MSGSAEAKFNQLFEGSVFEFLVSDLEGDTPTVSFAVNYKSAAVAIGDTPFTMPATESLTAPFKYQIMYDPADFSR